MSRSVSQFKLNAEQQKLVSDNLNLARREAWRYQRRTDIDYKILESVAFEGLCQAAYKYDPMMLNTRTGQSMRFSSIAVPYARGAILHYMRDKTYLLRLSHKMRENWLKGRRLIYQSKTDIQIAKSLDITLEEWLETRITCSGPPLELKDVAGFQDNKPEIEIDIATLYLQQAEKFLTSLTKQEVNQVASVFNPNVKTSREEANCILNNFLMLAEPHFNFDGKLT